MRYSEQEKIKIVCHFQNGATVQEICQQYGISRSTLYRWAAAPRTTTPDGEIFSLKEIRQLQRKVERLQAIVQILKVVNCTVSSPLHDKFAEMEKLRGQFEDHLLCDALDVPRGSFYNHVVYGKKENTWYHKRRKEYSLLIQKIFDENHQVLGARKVTEILKQEGHRVSEAFVSARMQELGLASVRNQAKQIYKNMRSRDSTKKDLIKQHFSVEKPNQTWVSDVTCYKLKDRYYYICVILDLYSRKVVAYKLSKKNSTQLLTSTFKQAWALRNPPEGLVFHSDRGAPYLSFSFQALLKNRQVQQSFSRPRTPHDNAVAESFFSTLKREELYRKDYTSEKHLVQSLAAYIDFYNSKRPHKTLGFLTPQEMEKGAIRSQRFKK